MRIEEFDYVLPEELVAQEPAPRRQDSRLLVLSRRGPLDCRVRRFAELPQLLRPGDLLVLNDARVLPLRLWARRSTGGRVEILLLRPCPAEGDPRPRWWALLRRSRRLRPGERLTLTPRADAGGEPAALEVEVLGERGEERRPVAFPGGTDVEAVLEAHGAMPVPPYIRRRPGDPREALDRVRYQTVYARAPGAVAAPTAGLHFTEGLLERIRQRGVEVTSLTLEVGPGTFRPVRSGRLDGHQVEPERYRIPREAAAAVAAARCRGGRVVAVGTTVVRALEHAAREGGAVVAGPGEADLFIAPGYRFRTVDALITNFHLPRSAPLILTAAFAGRKRLLAAYRQAVAAGLRFYSYGDAMLVQ